MTQHAPPKVYTVPEVLFYNFSRRSVMPMRWHKCGLKNLRIKLFSTRLTQQEEILLTGSEFYLCLFRALFSRSSPHQSLAQQIINKRHQHQEIYPQASRRVTKWLPTDVSIKLFNLYVKPINIYIFHCHSRQGIFIIYYVFHNPKLS